MRARMQTVNPCVHQRPQGQFTRPVLRLKNLSSEVHLQKVRRNLSKLGGVRLRPAAGRWGGTSKPWHLTGRPPGRGPCSPRPWKAPGACGAWGPALQHPSSGAEGRARCGAPGTTLSAQTRVGTAVPDRGQGPSLAETRPRSLRRFITGGDATNLNFKRLLRDLAREHEKRDRRSDTGHRKEDTQTAASPGPPRGGLPLVLVDGAPPRTARERAGQQRTGHRQGATIPAARISGLRDARPHRPAARP